MKAFDVCVQGQGAVGMALALALARQGLSVAWRGPHATASAQRSDVRAYALSVTSVTLLETLKVWSALPPDARTAVQRMHVQGDVPGAALNFSALEQGVEALTWIVDAAELDQALAAAIRFAPHVQPVDEEVPAALQALAEGRDSAGRRQRGVAMPLHRYGQVAVAGRLRCEQPHQGIARQWFRSPDVLALLPLDRPRAGHGYGLVWSVPQARAEELLALSDPDFEAALAQATGMPAGAFHLLGPRAAWPLMLGRAEQLCGSGWVLLGDAAHVVHPLAGQGLNLGLADVQALAAVLAAREPFRALGDERLLRRYVRQRELSVQAMGQMTDGLLELFAHPHPLAKELRNRGLNLLDTLSPLKRLLTQQAMRS